MDCLSFATKSCSMCKRQHLGEFYYLFSFLMLCFFFWFQVNLKSVLPTLIFRFQILVLTDVKVWWIQKNLIKTLMKAAKHSHTFFQLVSKKSPCDDSLLHLLFWLNCEDGIEKCCWNLVFGKILEYTVLWWKRRSVCLTKISLNSSQKKSTVW